MLVHPPTGQWFHAADGQRWWFDSGSIAFDFAYTGGFGGPPEWEHWHAPSDLGRWLRERFGVEVPVDDAAYQRARELRGAIAGAVMVTAQACSIAASDAATIDRCAATQDLPPQLGSPVPPTSDRLLASIARDAVVSLRRPDRVRSCAASDCGVIYFDSSRSGSRTWCSMRRCGNRHKIRQLRARRAALTTTTTQEKLK